MTDLPSWTTPEELAGMVADLKALDAVLDRVDQGTAIACTTAFAFAHLLDRKGVASRASLADIIDVCAGIVPTRSDDDGTARTIAAGLAAVLRGDHQLKETGP